MNDTPFPPADAGAILSQILLKQGEMGTQLAVIAVQLTAVPDHEARIRSLERWRYSLPLSLFAAMSSGAVAVVSYFHK